MPIFAKIVSGAFHYIFVVPLTFIFLFIKYPISADLRNAYIGLFLALFVIFPLIFINIAIKKGWVSDFEASKREERYVSNVIGVFVALAFAIITNKLQLPEIYKLNALHFLVYGFLFGLITFYWKISYHLGVIGWLAAVIFTIYGITWMTVLPIAVISIITSWSRVYLKKHDVLQTIAAFILSFLIFEVLKAVTNFA